MASKAIFCAVLIVTMLAMGAWADVYMHSWRGSNNKLNEQSTNAQNQNRLFDSQNNAQGGYCRGPPLTVYEGSMTQIEWTNQHGCGPENKNVHCEIVLQYMCGPWIRDGLTTDRIPANDDPAVRDEMIGEEYRYGQHEPYLFYKHCATRERNYGLWTADRVLRGNLGRNGNPATRTRQNNNANRHGFECAEERDYYPYWHPTPWKDIAVLTGNVLRCNFFQTESQNVKEKGWCEDIQYGQYDRCPREKWRITPAWGLDPPDCVEAEWTRDNHLGNARSGRTAKYDWVLPSLSHPSFTASFPPFNDVPALTNPDNREEGAKCVFRMRYNISTAEANGWHHLDEPVAGHRMLDASQNDENSPVRQDPMVPFGPGGDNNLFNLSLAIDTTQFGRTFQDRSHMFILKPRPAGLALGARIFNLMVRGRRGNIVQAYPGVEYDFTPNDLKVYDGDYVHFQWTGCNPDGSPANQAGEGTDATDRSNVVQIDDGRDNYPTSFMEVTMFNDPEDIRALAHLDQPEYCVTGDQAGCCKTYEQLLQTNNADNNAIEEDVQNCAKLNMASAHFQRLVRMHGIDTTYHYMSSRNNNFSNRSQKGSITVMGLVPWWGTVFVAVGAAGFVAAAVLAGGVWYSNSHAGSAISNILGNCAV